MNTSLHGISALLLALAPLAGGQQAPSEAQSPSFEGAAASVQEKLESSVAELNALRERIAAEKIPLGRQLRELESELIVVRQDYQQTTRLLDSRTLDLTNLRTEIQSREDEAAYLSNLLSQYIGEFEAGLHIAELQRYEGPLEAAKLAPENSNLSQEEVYAAQAELLGVSLGRLEEALGGARFEGTAVDPSGLVREGTFALIGPAALFRSSDGEVVGTAEQRLGSLEPAVITFADPEVSLAAARVVTSGTGSFPLDPTQGNAHKIEATRETIWEHIQKGGPVMVPIFAMAGAALLVALYKWLALSFVRKPSRKAIQSVLQAVEERDEEAIHRNVRAVKGPAGRMLVAGVQHMREPRDLIEEVMYETVLTTRLKLERMLPFIAIAAASAPLLGLLGTVTGIINTFKLITVFGSGDVKTLSGGISEALITTEFGLIVAIPSLLLHAFLSRKAKGIVHRMETTAVAFLNKLGKGGEDAVPAAPTTTSEGGERSVYSLPDPDAVRAQVKEILGEMMSAAATREGRDDRSRKAQASQPG
jgi:biopolymer transport protein ExbB